MTSWLTLQEYSIQNGISVSTLRRKIKNSELKYKLENGKYLIEASLKRKEEIKLSENELFHEKEKELKELKTLKADKEDLLSLVSFLENEKQELETHFKTLQTDHRDLLQLLSFLENEKKELIQYIEKQKTAAPAIY